MSTLALYDDLLRWRVDIMMSLVVNCWAEVMSDLLSVCR